VGLRPRCGEAARLRRTQILDVGQARNSNRAFVAGTGARPLAFPGLYCREPIRSDPVAARPDGEQGGGLGVVCSTGSGPRRLTIPGAAGFRRGCPMAGDQPGPRHSPGIRILRLMSPCDTLGGHQQLQRLVAGYAAEIAAVPSHQPLHESPR